MSSNEFFLILPSSGSVVRRRKLPDGASNASFDTHECNKGLAQVSLEHGIPVAFGVITTDTIEQAIERSGTKAGNKGSEAAHSALEMVNVIDQVHLQLVS